MSMSDDTKRRLREAARAKRGVLLKDLDTACLLVSCDHWEEFGNPLLGDWGALCEPSEQEEPGRWVWRRHGSRACYLRWASPAQVQCLEGRLPHRRILLPVAGYHLNNFIIPIYDRAGRRCRIVTAFPVAAIRHILDFNRVKDSAKYYRPLAYELDWYDPYLPTENESC